MLFTSFSQKYETQIDKTVTLYVRDGSAVALRGQIDFIPIVNTYVKPTSELVASSCGSLWPDAERY